jgi:hypothetical protein
MGFHLFAQVSEEQTIKGIYKSALTNANVTVGLTIYPIKLSRLSGSANADKAVLFTLNRN